MRSSIGKFDMLKIAIYDRHLNADTVFCVMAVVGFVLFIWYFLVQGSIIKTIEFMFAGINMFWARLRLIFARAVRRGLK